MKNIILKTFLIVATALQTTSSFAQQKIDLNQMFFMPRSIIPLEKIGLKAPAWKRVNVKGIINNSSVDYTITKFSDDKFTIVGKIPKMNLLVSKGNVVRVVGKKYESNVDYTVKLENSGKYHVLGSIDAGCSGVDYLISAIDQGILVSDGNCENFSYSIVNHGTGELTVTRKGKLDIAKEFKIETDKNKYKIQGGDGNFAMNFTIDFID